MLLDRLFLAAPARAGLVLAGKRSLHAAVIAHFLTVASAGWRADRHGARALGLLRLGGRSRTRVDGH